MLKCKLGICSVSFREYSPEEIAKAVSDAGLECIEWGSDIHAPCMDAEAIGNIVSIQKKYGISCSSYGTYYNLESDDFDDLPHYIKAANMLGTNILRLWCGSKGSASYTEEEKVNLFDVCKKAAALAESEGVILCMECHHGSFTDTADSICELMEAVDSPNFRMYWQAEGIGEEELNLNFARRVSQYTVNIHVFYYVNSVQHSLHDGIEIWRRYLLEFSGEKALLLEFLPDGKIESLPTEAEALKKIAGK